MTYELTYTINGATVTSHGSRDQMLAELAEALDAAYPRAFSGLCLNASENDIDEAISDGGLGGQVSYSIKLVPVTLQRLGV